MTLSKLMKLYATTTSERASKGQGGNEYLDIDIQVGSAKQSQYLARLTVRQQGESFVLIDEDDIVLKEITIKGEKQKSERVCDKCKSRTRTSLQDFYCPWCGYHNS